MDPDLPEPEDPGMDPFEPWGVDASKLIPDLVAAVRALSHFNTQLVTALTSILNPADPATFSSLADLIPEG